MRHGASSKFVSVNIGRQIWVFFMGKSHCGEKSLWRKATVETVETGYSSSKSHTGEKSHDRHTLEKGHMTHCHTPGLALASAQETSPSSSSLSLSLKLKLIHIVDSLSWRNSIIFSVLVFMYRDWAGVERLFLRRPFFEQTSTLNAAHVREIWLIFSVNSWTFENFYKVYKLCMGNCR